MQMAHNSVTLRGATGYLYGANELHGLCEKLYSNSDKNMTARNMTIEDLDKATGNSAPANSKRYAWYTSDVTDADLKDVTAEGKVYTAKRHQGELYGGITKPRFYEWDDENGVTHTARDGSSTSAWEIK